MATMEQREEQFDELSERYCHLEERLELEREELDSFREENKRLREAFIAAVSRPMGIVLNGYEDIYQAALNQEEQ